MAKRTHKVKTSALPTKFVDGFHVHDFHVQLNIAKYLEVCRSDGTVVLVTLNKQQYTDLLNMQVPTCS